MTLNALTVRTICALSGTHGAALTLFKRNAIQCLHFAKSRPLIFAMFEKIMPSGANIAKIRVQSQIIVMQTVTQRASKVCSENIV